MALLRLWFTGIVHPARALDELRTRPAPRWGLLAVLTRFVGTSLTTEVLNLVFHVRPFQPSYLTFLPTESYYRYQPFFLPVFGLVAWLLMSSVAHVAIRLAGRHCDYDQVLNIVGLGMLMPMLLVWPFDWAMIALGTFQLLVMSVSHSLFQLWEACFQAAGFRRILGLSALPAIVLAVSINVLFVLLGSLFVR